MLFWYYYRTLRKRDGKNGLKIPLKIGGLHSKYAGVYLIARKGDFVLIFARKNKERRCIDANVQSIG
jgi:hypothetical protein